MRVISLLKFSLLPALGLNVPDLIASCISFAFKVFSDVFRGISLFVESIEITVREDIFNYALVLNFVVAFRVNFFLLYIFQIAVMLSII